MKINRDCTFLFQDKKDFREIAERRVRLGLLLSEVGRANNVQISQEDVNSQLMAEARRHPGREKEVMEHYKNNPEAMEELSALRVTTLALAK